MYFKIENGMIQNSRTPIEGGFEQSGLEFECDANRLRIVSDTEVRDITNEEIYEGEEQNLKQAYFQAADSYVGEGLSASAYAYTCMRALSGDLKAQSNLAWALRCWDHHNSLIDALSADNFMKVTEASFDFSSMGPKPYSVRDY